MNIYMTILVTYEVSSKGYWKHNRITRRKPSLLMILSILYNNQPVGNIVGPPRTRPRFNPLL